VRGKGTFEEKKMTSKHLSGLRRDGEDVPCRHTLNIGLFAAAFLYAGLTLGPRCCAAADTQLSGVQGDLDSYIGTAFGSVSGYSFAFTEHAQHTLMMMAGGNLLSDSVVQLASATKVPAAIAILTLVDARKLDLDIPVRKYLKKFDASFQWPSDKNAITMRMLLSHTAGFPSPPNPDTGYCLNMQFTTLKSCAQYIADAALDFKPGTTFSYTGVDYQVAGYIATLISGKSWNDFFTDALAGPLGLSTFSYGPGGNPRIAGGGQCDASDYSKILRMLLRHGRADNGKRVLSHKLIRALETNQTKGLTIEPLPSLFFNGGTSLKNEFAGYTLGFFILNDSIVATSGSPGPIFADPGSYGATAWIDTSMNYGGILLIDANTTVGLDMMATVVPAIVSDLSRP
jgi:CubicO group peptidase (beta-lactamase class C family)